MTAPVQSISLQQLQQLAYEAPPPFLIQLGGQAVACTRLLRVVPGKRLVFLGRFADETAIVKLFIHTSKARTHWSRELDGVALLKANQILTPALIGSGKSEEGIFVLVFRYIKGQDLASLWKKNGDAEREQRMMDMMPLLAQHHQAGLTHQDLHYGNFLIGSDEQIYTLDAEEVRSYSAPLRKTPRLKNLALFLAQTFDLSIAFSISLLNQYAHASAIALNQHDPEIFLGWIRHFHQQRIDQYSKKILRECTEVICSGTQSGYTLCRREHYKAGIQALLENPEKFFDADASVYLKQGNTCTVKSVEISGNRYVMKRYNPKGVLYELAHKGQFSRARKSWINAHLLRFIGIPTPEPIALIESQPALGRRCSYFISQQIEGQNSWDFFCDLDLSNENKRQAADDLINTLRQLHENRISHGDMKGSNFLIGANKVWVIDLDALIQHKRNRAFKASWKRDKERFFRNWTKKACYEPWMRYFRQHWLDDQPRQP
jgi:tRNA A-37 threonylcarbamoyl transferase component Bud32